MERILALGFSGLWATRIPDRRASPDHFLNGGKRRASGFPREDQSIGTGWRRRRPGVSQRKSTCIGADGEKAVSKLPRHIAKTWWNAAAMAADLTVVEDHRQCVGKDADHGQYDEGTVLMGGGLLQVAIRGDGLKGLRVNGPATASELVDEARRNSAKIHVRRIKVGADNGSGSFRFYPGAFGLSALSCFRFRLFDLGCLDLAPLDLDALGVLHPNRLHDSHGTAGHGPVHLRHVPELQVLFGSRFVVLRRTRGEPFGFRQQAGLVVLEVDDPVQGECFHLPNEGSL